MTEQHEKSVWIVNQYIGTPVLKIDGHRHYYLARKLKERGYIVSLLTSSFSHVPSKAYGSKNTFEIVEEEYGRLGIIQTPKYKSARGLGRIWNMVIFMLKLFFFPVKKLPKPDIIIISSISLLPILNGFLWRRKFNCKLILEIRDIWPLTLIELGGFKKYNPFVLFLEFIEKLGYRKYNFITSLLPLTYNHVESVLKRKVTNFAHIPNGIFLEEKKTNQPLNEITLNQIPKDKFIIGYAGSLGIANAMECFIAAANQLQKEEDIVFCIVGDGYLKEDLKKLAKDNPLIIFLDPIPKKEIEALLSNFDILFLSWQDKPLYRFGVSANKIFDYMYAAKPIIMSGNIGDNIIEKAECGITTAPLDVEAIRKAIITLKEKSSEELNIIGLAGKNYVLSNNTFEVLTNKYISIFEQL